MPSATRLTRAGAFVLGVLLLSACAKNAPMDTFKPESDQADTIFTLVKPVFIIAGLVFFLVQGGVLFIVFKFRRHKGDDEVPEQIHGHDSLELAWTIAPFLLLVGVTIFTVSTIIDLSHQPEGAREINVYGQQWWWAYEYDANDDGTVDFVTANDMVIPAGEDIVLNITSRDVIHSFWAPRLFGKKDAVPGRTHTITVSAAKPGEYYGQCTEFCGLSHAYMRLRVIALSPPDYDAWVANQLKPARIPTTASQKAGLEVFKTQCVSCHQIRGVDDEDYTGADQVSGAAPDLTHFATRGVFAGAMFDLYRDNDDDKFPDIGGEFHTDALEAWLRDPSAVKPLAPDEKRGMPDLGLSEEQIDDLVAYLTSLD